MPGCSGGSQPSSRWRPWAVGARRRNEGCCRDVLSVGAGRLFNGLFN